MKVPRLSHFVDPSPWTMTTRARVYLSAAGARHFIIGASLLASPWLYSSAAFVPLFNLLSIPLWGVIMTVEGIICLSAALFRNADLARAGMAISAVVTLVLGAGLAIGITTAWLVWVDRVGWEQVHYLLWTRPPVYPPDLLGLGPAPPSPFLPIVMLTLTVKDFTICAQPLRVPLEERAPRRIKGA